MYTRPCGIFSCENREPEVRFDRVSGSFSGNAEFGIAETVCSGRLVFAAHITRRACSANITAPARGGFVPHPPLRRSPFPKGKARRGRRRSIASLFEGGGTRRVTEGVRSPCAVLPHTSLTERARRTSLPRRGTPLPYRISAPRHPHSHVPRNHPRLFLADCADFVH